MRYAMVAQWISNLDSAEKQLELFEHKIVGKNGWIDKTVNSLLNLKEKANTLAQEGNIDEVHNTYMEMASLWGLLRGIEQSIRTKYPVLCHIFDVLVYLYRLGSNNHWSIIGMSEQLVLDSWPHIKSLFAKIMAERQN